MPAAAQQPDLNVWLTLAGTKQQVLDTLEKRASTLEMPHEHWHEHSCLFLRFENSRKDSVVLGGIGSVSGAKR